MKESVWEIMSPLNSNDRRAFKTVKAAMYVRMSTEHQQYSTENQEEIIFEYARKNSMEIVKTYSDEGKSGLSIEGRKSLRQLIEDVDIPSW
jgi:DNA invertase Pin-like site-specific DNA recombinase